MRLLALVWLFLVAATPAFAWSARGHELIATVAYEQLTPRARAAVDLLTASDFSASPGCPITSFSETATWSDCVRAISSYRNQSPWHYDNIPACGTASYETYCANGNCATAAIVRAERTVANTNASQRDRQRALARIVHFVGDIHQPLHAVSNNDRGGNDVRVALDRSWSGASSANNLHAAWDDALVAFALGADGAGTLRNLARANQRAWSVGDARAWASQAHDYAIRVTYRNLPSGLECDAPAAGTVRLDRAYATAAAPVIREQLAKASVRLAMTLNRLFA